MPEEELLAHVYASLFNFPLTPKEAKIWRIKLQKKSDEKLEIAKKVTSTLQKIPFIEAIFVTGSVAAQNADKKADIDLMIVTANNTLWLTRAMVVGYLQIKKIYKDIICPNIFLDTNHLGINSKNVYTAHEILQAKCLFDRSNIAKEWIVENKWVKDYLPEAYKKINKTNTPTPNHINSQSTNFQYWTLAIGILELLAFIGQYLYMKHKMTNENIGLGYAFFHPRNLSKSVVDRFSKKLQKLGIMEE